MPDTMTDSKTFRKTMAHFATGVTVVCAAHEGALAGMTVNSFTSVSLEPPLVLFCPHRDSHIMEVLSQSGHFSINILAEDQIDTCMAFAGKVERELRFNDDNHVMSESGTPLLTGVLAHLECKLQAVHPGGDHQIVIGEVFSLDYRDGRPLLFFNSEFPLLA